ncbi:putative serine/threonine-protein kinase [Sesbania bispinosa]|nr:putative serine/threonine-protein kinase [Sesbania bispinosa]
MLSIFLLCLFFFTFRHCSARDTITINNSLQDGGEDTLISAGESFELGFFTPNGSTSGKRYVGIWYYNLTPQTVVWVANRDNPLPDSGGSFAIAEDGNLRVMDRNGKSYWGTNLERSSSHNKTVKLLDTGNLIISNVDQENHPVKILWQSFANPTDTFLPGMKMSDSLALTSWRSYEDPARGNYSFEQDQGENQYIIWKRSIRYWKSSVSGKFVGTGEMSSAISYLLSNFSMRISPNNTVPFLTSSLYSDTRLVMTYWGQLQYLKMDSEKKWLLVWVEPRDRCSVFNACGNFGSCNSKYDSMCKCLPGFKPNSIENWNAGDYSGGCSRETNVCSEDAKSDTFLSLKMMKVGNPDAQFNAKSEQECMSECLNNCQCYAYSYEDTAKQGDGGHADAICWIWYEDLNNLEEEYEGGCDLHVRVAFSDIEEDSYQTERPVSSQKIIALIFTTVFFLIILSSTITCIYLRKRRKAKTQESRVYVQKNSGINLYDSERYVRDLIESGRFKEDDAQAIDIPHFHLESILDATNNFANANKLGQGGFGPVYKGKFPGGQEVAVKRLSSCSGQGLEEFKNEVVLIAKLQHRNLVRLLGYCLEGDEKMLVYEYMPNRSLDAFIFDRKLCGSLDWDMRFKIILGIARGLLYLHEDSRLRIIHRDLKTSNILLDEEKNPKISDFGLARIFGGKETVANTDRVVGTYGYMSPEYALDGHFSVKSDVFSFGVVVLEIISGKRNTGFYQPEHELSLLGYAWHLWKVGRALDFMDQTLYETCNADECLKCVNVGLLCLQEDPNERPTMSNVVFMLGSESNTLPTPKEPAFVSRRCPSSRASTSSKVETFSRNELTVTLENGR